MLLFRAEEDVDAWCRAHRRERGATLSLPVLRALAERWYGDRLDPGWRPRSAAQSQDIFTELGLTGAFWRLPA